jgi:hypothetical protein
LNALLIGANGDISRDIMPQIWMTYEELAGLLECSTMEARSRVHLERLDRKLSRDGHQRAKLNMAMMRVFIARLKTIDDAADRAVGDLRQAHRLLSGRAEPPAPSAFDWLRPGRTG